MADFATLLRAGADQLSGLGALVNGRALGGPLLRQRVKLDAFVERRASYVARAASPRASPRAAITRTARSLLPVAAAVAAVNLSDQFAESPI